MNIPTKKAMLALLADWRALIPHRPLTYGESLHGARLQAEQVRKRAMQGDALAINLIWFIKQAAVPVSFVSSYKLGEESGLTTDKVDGRVRVFINDNEPRLRQRFSAAHELKHVIDFPLANTLHAKLGRGDKQLQHDLIERIANEFAAHVLMPTMHVKRLWFKHQHIGTLAKRFDVSVEAMATRLEKLGLIGETKTQPRMYFRRPGHIAELPSLDPDEYLAV
jgi:Zn-dependent peptidase ImmA (M78 family)